jgi:hypothetical protein
MKTLNENILCYLTPEANKALIELKNVGLDEDLALNVLEKIWPESAIYELPSEKGESVQ